MNEVKQVLQGARALIADRSDWRQGYLTGADGGGYCAIGAVLAARYGAVSPLRWWSKDDYLIEPLLDVVPETRPPMAICETRPPMAIWDGPRVGRITGYNDTHSHECVIAMFDAAIEKCDEK